MVPYGYSLWRFYSTHVITDNAQIEGEIVPIGARVAGTVRTVAVKENEPVQAGQVLLTVDPRDYQVRVEQARAALAMARSQLQAAAGEVPLSRDSATSQVDQAMAAWRAAQMGVEGARRVLEGAQAVLASKRAAAAAAAAEVRSRQAELHQARLQFDRMRQLAAAGVVSRQGYELAEATLQTAQASVEASQERLKQAETEVGQAGAEVAMKGLEIDRAREEEAAARARLQGARVGEQTVAIREAEARAASAKLQEAQSNLKLVELQLKDTAVSAPIGGVVSRKGVEAGQQVQIGQPLMALIPLQGLWVVANFKETQLTHLRPGQPAQVRVDTYPGERFRGVVESISAGTGAKFSLLPPENATGNFVKVVQRLPVRIRLEPPFPSSSVLRPGMSVVVTVKVR